MRTVEDIDRDITKVVECLTALLMERKLTEKIEAGMRASAEIISEKLIARTKDKGWEPGL
jgi:hypothetical protein